MNKETISKEAFFQLLKDVLHGDQEHKNWLTEAFHAAWNETPVPLPRGSGTKDRLYREIHRLQDELDSLKKR